MLKSVVYYGEVTERFLFERKAQHSNYKNCKFPQKDYAVIVVRTHYAGQVKNDFMNSEGFEAILDEFLMERLHEIYDCFMSTHLVSTGKGKGWSNGIFKKIIKEDQQNGNVLLKKLYVDLKTALIHGEFVVDGVSYFR